MVALVVLTLDAAPLLLLLLLLLLAAVLLLRRLPPRLQLLSTPPPAVSALHSSRVLTTITILSATISERSSWRRTAAAH